MTSSFMPYLTISLHDSALISAPIDQVWELVGSFDRVERYHGLVEASTWETPPVVPDLVGAVRRLTLRNGAQVNEQLLARSARDHTFQYEMLAPPFPARHFQVSVRLLPVTHTNETLLEYHVKFEADSGQVNEIESIVRAANAQAFEGLRQYFIGFIPAIS